MDHLREKLLADAAFTRNEYRKIGRTILTPPRRGMMMMGRAVTPAEYTADQKREAQAIAEVERTVTNIQNYKRALEESPEMEMRSILNALAGGYVAPTSGGDAVANPQAVPTGRNLYAVNAETTPSEQAWAKGKELVNSFVPTEI